MSEVDDINSKEEESDEIYRSQESIHRGKTLRDDILKISQKQNLTLQAFESKIDKKFDFVMKLLEEMKPEKQ